MLERDTSIRLKQWCRLLALSALLAGCGANEVAPFTADDWQPEKPVHQVGSLYFAAQPDRAMLEDASNHGIDMVINLRGADEQSWNQAEAVEALGMDYINVPVSRSGPGFDRQAMEKLHAVINSNQDKKILMHCSSGNRVSAWYAVYLVEQQNMSIEQALQQARESGLTRPELEQRVRTYLN